VTRTVTVLRSCYILEAPDALLCNIGAPIPMRTFHRLLLACLVLCLCTQVLPGDVDAQTTEIEELRAVRDEARAERSRAAADLNPLLAANEQIEEALRLLSEDLSARESALEATRARLDKARSDVASAKAQVAAEQQNITDLRVQLQRQAISAYVQPRGDDQLLASEDINDGQRRRALFSAVSTSRNDILDQLRIAEANRELAVGRAEVAEREILSREAQAVEQLAEVNASIADQQRLAEILEERIVEFQAEIDAHAAGEDALTNRLVGLIVEEEARQEAIREAARIQAERERVAREEAAREAQRLADLAAGRVPVDTAVDRSNAGLVGAPTTGTSSLINPLAGGTLTSSFGPRWGRMHNGIDLAANIGTPVIAAGSGRVIGAGNEGGFGLLVTIDHGGGLVTAYAHLNQINVTPGQQISAGNSVGTVGSTGNSTGPHLHFETRVNGVAYNPTQYLS